jgi:hypothetical protein
MSEVRTFFQNRIVSGEKLLDLAENLKIEIGFVPVGQPTGNIAPSYNGNIALTDSRLIVQWVYDGRYRVYSALAIFGLSERYFVPGHSSKWPYQAILILPGGMSLVVETIDRTAQPAEQLSSFLTKALFLLGKRDGDIGSMAAMNAHLEELRRREDEHRRQDD